MFSNPSGSQQHNSFGCKNWTPGISLFQLHHLCRGWFTATRWFAGARQSDNLPVAVWMNRYRSSHSFWRSWEISANATIYSDFNLQQHLVVKWKGQGAFVKEVNSTNGSQVRRRSWAHPGTAKVDGFLWYIRGLRTLCNKIQHLISRQQGRSHCDWNHLPEAPVKPRRWGRAKKDGAAPGDNSAPVVIYRTRRWREVSKNRKNL